MQIILDFFKNYWSQILFIVGIFTGFYKFTISMIEATKCSLRNDILSIWDRCKDKKKITKYQLQAIKYSYEQYKKLKGNSFIDDIVERVKDFEIID